MKFRSRLVADIGEERVKRLEAKAELNGERYLPREWLIEEIERYRKLNIGIACLLIGAGITGIIEGVKNE